MFLSQDLTEDEFKALRVIEYMRSYHLPRDIAYEIACDEWKIRVDVRGMDSLPQGKLRQASPVPGFGRRPLTADTETRRARQSIYRAAERSRERRRVRNLRASLAGADPLDSGNDKKRTKTISYRAEDTGDIKRLQYDAALLERLRVRPRLTRADIAEIFLREPEQIEALKRLNFPQVNRGTIKTYRLYDWMKTMLEAL